MEAAITQLEINLATIKNNAPINEAEGNTAHAALKRANAASYQTAIGMLKTHQ